jgi:Putative Actinobacterial Holin-X, holin superfamily III
MLSDESRLGPEISPGRPRMDRSVAELLSDFANEIGTLIRQEIALFKAEFGEKLGRTGMGVAAIAAGGLVAFSGWLAVIAAAILGLCNVLSPWLAALLVGVVVIAIGAALLWFGKSRLDADALVPRRTLNSLRADEE